MVTMMLILTVGALAVVITSWFGSAHHAHHGNMHATDLMAGDEGED